MRKKKKKNCDDSLSYVLALLTAMCSWKECSHGAFGGVDFMGSDAAAGQGTRLVFFFFSLSHFGTLVHWMAIRTPDTNKRHRGHTTLTQVRGNFDWNTKK
jgi:hypothetical protein